MENVILENLSKEELIEEIKVLKNEVERLNVRYDTLNVLRFKLEERLMSINLLSEV